MTKRCCKCKIEKDLTCFTKCSSSKDGLDKRCRECAHIHSMLPATIERKAKRAKELREQRMKDPIWVLKEKKREYEYRMKNAARIQKKKNEWARKKFKESPHFRVRLNISHHLRGCIRNSGERKKENSTKYIGCSFADFIKYIESTWKPNMNWNNYGRGPSSWQLDHIIPCRAFDLSKEEEQKKCFHWSNYQALWTLENMSKGAKLPDGTDLRTNK